MIRLSAFADEAASDLAGQIAALKRNAIPYTDVRSIDGVNVGAMTVAAAAEYAGALAGEGIGVWSLGSPLGKCDVCTSPAVLLENLRRLAEIAHVFGCDRIRIFSFFNAYGESERVIGTLTALVAEAKALGVRLYHENEKKVYGDTVKRVLELRDRVEGLNFIYDPANFLQVGEDPSIAFGAVGRSADFYHVKDMVAATGEIVPAGMGDCGLREMLAAIEGDTVLTLEPHLMEFAGYRAIDGSPLGNAFPDNAAAFDFAARSLAELLLSVGYRRVGDAYERPTGRGAEA